MGTRTYSRRRVDGTRVLTALGRQRAGIVGQDIDIFGNPLDTPNIPNTPAPAVVNTQQAPSTTVKALGEKADRVLMRGEDDKLVYVMDEAAREGLTELPFTTSDGREFVLSYGDASGVKVGLSPESQAEASEFIRNISTAPRKSVVTSDDPAYARSFHPAAYFLAEAQREYMLHPTTERYNRMERLEKQYQAERNTYPDKVSQFEADYKKGGGALPLPRSIVMARALTEAPSIVQQARTMERIAMEPPTTVAKMRKALKLLGTYNANLGNAFSRAMRYGTAWAQGSGLITRADFEEERYEAQRYLNNANRIQQVIDAGIKRNPKLAKQVSDYDRQSAQIRQDQNSRLFPGLNVT